MKDILLKILIGFATFLILLGILFAFIDLQIIKINIGNDGYVAALFSLSGLLFFCSALMYQIKEYKLQVAELQKSVEAQTKSSEALDEQKKILLEQNTNNLIFGMISSFIDFRERNKLNEIIDEILEHEQGYFALKWENNQKELRLNQKELNERFALDIKSLFSQTIVSFEQFPLIKQYILFIYNIFSIIDENRINLTKDYFSSFVYIQLTNNEKLILCLSNLVDSNMPQYENLYWGNYETENIMNWIKQYKNGQYIDYKDMNRNVLTETFNLIKQHDPIKPRT